MFNLCLLLNRGQLAFIALPFQARFGANLFSVDIKGQFTLLFGKYFSYFFLNSHKNILPAIRKQNGKHFNRVNRVITNSSIHLINLCQDQRVDVSVTAILESRLILCIFTHLVVFSYNARWSSLQYTFGFHSLSTNCTNIETCLYIWYLFSMIRRAVSSSWSIQRL